MELWVDGSSPSFPPNLINTRELAQLVEQKYKKSFLNFLCFFKILQVAMNGLLLLVKHTLSIFPLQNICGSEIWVTSIAN